MPRGDRTGPKGMGAMSGRAAGFCAGYGMPGFANASFGRGFGMGFGRTAGFRGRGAGGGYRWRNWFHATRMPAEMRFSGYAEPYAYPASHKRPDPEMEKQALKNHADALQAELEFIHKRLSEVEKETPLE